MPAKATTRNTIKNNTIKELKKLGIFKPEFEGVISLYAVTCEQYFSVLKRFDIADYESRSPLALSLENLRNDLLRQSAQLGLTPAGLKKITGIVDTKQKGKLAQALNQLE